MHTFKLGLLNTLLFFHIEINNNNRPLSTIFDQLHLLKYIIPHEHN